MLQYFLQGKTRLPHHITSRIDFSLACAVKSLSLTHNIYRCAVFYREFVINMFIVRPLSCHFFHYLSCKGLLLCINAFPFLRHSTFFYVFLATHVSTACSSTTCSLNAVLYTFTLIFTFILLSQILSCSSSVSYLRVTDQISIIYPRYLNVLILFTV